MSSKFSFTNESRNNNASILIKKAFVSLILCTIIVASLFIFTACDDTVLVKEGTITQKIYGHPVYEEKGDFSFYIAGDNDYFVYAENGKDGQWFRVLNIPLYMGLSEGDHFVYSPENYKLVTSFMDRS